MPSDSPIDEFAEIGSFDEFECNGTFVGKVTSPDGIEEVYSPDEACDVICDLVADQFWDWWSDPARRRRFKPRLKVYEVLESC